MAAIISRYERTTIPAALSVEKIPGGLKVCDANGQSLAYVYSRENANDAHMAKVLTEDKARRIASNIAKLPALLGKVDALASVGGLSLVTLPASYGAQNNGYANFYGHLMA
jgi:hypothetical protein